MLLVQSHKSDRMMKNEAELCSLSVVSPVCFYSGASLGAC